MLGHVVLMLGQRLRRWPNIKATLDRVYWDSANQVVIISGQM